MVEVIKNGIETCAGTAYLQLHTYPKKTFLTSYKIGIFLKAGKKNESKIFCNGLQQMFCNHASKSLPIFSTGFAWRFSNKTALLLKGAAPVTYSVHTVLHNFSNVYKWPLVQSGQSLGAFLPFE